ncbi:MotA/TolQ/ExbB proton channel family protein [Fusobacterium sp.]|uniref:MotA/TolQ/ExbB proton channel family protein n=1 Tax=Fusobacterium sp. TaxID=68766 RepID=UPI00396C56EF
MLYYLKVGGPLMWILFAMSIISLTVILERTCFFCRRERFHNKNFSTDIITAVASQDINCAIGLCERENNSVGCTVKKFLCRCDHNGDFHHFDQLVKEIGIDEIGSLEKRLHILGIIGYTAPMIGLLGTVTGMILAFQNMASLGAGDPTVVASGISQALVTTAGGLIIAIPTIIAYNLFNKKIEDTEGQIDKITTNLINILRKN